MNKQLFEKQSNSYKPIYPLVRLEDIIDTISDKSIQWILNNYNHIYVEYSESVAVTRNKVPQLLRRTGIWISYNAGTEVITEYYKGDNKDVTNFIKWTNDDNWERFDKIKHLDGSITYQHLSESLRQLIGQGNNITNFPDDEDLEVKDGLLKFKDRDFEPNNFSGLGRVILRKNIKTVDGQPKNVLTQDMINKENTIYEIRYDFDLNGVEITIPDGCVLDFQGGSLNNGTVNINNVSIISELRQIFFNVNIIGNYNGKFNAIWSFGKYNENINIESIPYLWVDFNNGIYYSKTDFRAYEGVKWENGTITIPSISLVGGVEESCNCYGSGNENVITLLGELKTNPIGKIVIIKAAENVPLDYRLDGRGVPTLFKGITTICEDKKDTLLYIKGYMDKFEAEKVYNEITVKSTISVCKHINVLFNNMSFFLSGALNNKITKGISIGYAYDVKITNSKFNIDTIDTIGAGSLLSLNSCCKGIVDSCHVENANYETTDTSYGIQLNGSSDIIIQNCHFSNNRRGVDMSGSHESRYNIVQSCVFDGSKSYDKGSALGGHSTSYGNVYKNNIINGNFQVGVQCRGSYEVVDGNIFNSYCRGALISTGYFTAVANNCNQSKHTTSKTGTILSIFGTDVYNEINVHNNFFECRNVFTYTPIDNNNTRLYITNNVINIYSNTAKDCFIFSNPCKTTFYNNKINQKLVSKLWFFPENSNYEFKAVKLNYTFELEFKKWVGGIQDLTENDFNKITLNKANVYLNNVDKYQGRIEVDFTISETLIDSVGLVIKNSSMRYFNDGSFYTFNTIVHPVCMSPVNGKQLAVGIDDRLLYLGLGDSINGKLEAGEYKAVIYF